MTPKPQTLTAWPGRSMQSVQSAFLRALAWLLLAATVLALSGCAALWAQNPSSEA